MGGEEKIVCSTGFPGLDWRYVFASYHGVLPALSLHFHALSVFPTLLFPSFLLSISMLPGLSKTHSSTCEYCLAPLVS